MDNPLTRKIYFKRKFETVPDEQQRNFRPRVLPSPGDLITSGSPPPAPPPSSLSDSLLPPPPPLTTPSLPGDSLLTSGHPLVPHANSTSILKSQHKHQPPPPPPPPTFASHDTPHPLGDQNDIFGSTFSGHVIPRKPHLERPNSPQLPPRLKTIAPHPCGSVHSNQPMLDRLQPPNGPTPESQVLGNIRIPGIFRKSDNDLKTLYEHYDQDEKTEMNQIFELFLISHVRVTEDVDKWNVGRAEFNMLYECSYQEIKCLPRQNRIQRVVSFVDKTQDQQIRALLEFYEKNASELLYAAKQAQAAQDYITTPGNRRSKPLGKRVKENLKNNLKLRNNIPWLTWLPGRKDKTGSFTLYKNDHLNRAFKERHPLAPYFEENRSSKVSKVLLSASRSREESADILGGTGHSRRKSSQTDTVVNHKYVKIDENDFFDVIIAPVAEPKTLRVSTLTLDRGTKNKIAVHCKNYLSFGVANNRSYEISCPRNVAIEAAPDFDYSRGTLLIRFPCHAVDYEHEPRRNNGMALDYVA